MSKLELDRRKAIAGTIVMAVVFAGGIFIILMDAAYTGMVLDQVDWHLGDNYRSSLAGERVLESPYFTKERGVFYNSSVMSGDFGSITATKSIYLRFLTDCGNYTWRIYPKSDATVVDAVGDVDIRFQQTYKIAIYDSLREKTQPAILRVGVSQ